MFDSEDKKAFVCQVLFKNQYNKFDELWGKCAGGDVSRDKLVQLFDALLYHRGWFPDFRFVGVVEKIQSSVVQVKLAMLRTHLIEVAKFRFEKNSEFAETQVGDEVSFLLSPQCSANVKRKIQRTV